MRLGWSRCPIRGLCARSCPVPGWPSGLLLVGSRNRGLCSRNRSLRLRGAGGRCGLVECRLARGMVVVIAVVVAGSGGVDRVGREVG